MSEMRKLLEILNNFNNTKQPLTESIQSNKKTLSNNLTFNNKLLKEIANIKDHWFKNHAIKELQSRGMSLNEIFDVNKSRKTKTLTERSNSNKQKKSKSVANHNDKFRSKSGVSKKNESFDILTRNFSKKLNKISENIVEGYPDNFSSTDFRNAWGGDRRHVFNRLYDDIKNEANAYNVDEYLENTAPEDIDDALDAIAEDVFDILKSQVEDHEMDDWYDSFDDVVNLVKSVIEPKIRRYY